MLLQALKNKTYEIISGLAATGTTGEVYYNQTNRLQEIQNLIENKQLKEPESKTNDMVGGKRRKKRKSQKKKKRKSQKKKRKGTKRKGTKRK